jgi:CelD/BcsL family acetyltransferase involved in cellulose biosynthesis
MPARPLTPAARLMDTVPSTTVAPTTAPPLETSPTTTLPAYHRRLAWVGIAWGATVTCGASTTTQPASGTATTYVAVVIDARAAHRVIAYRSAGTSPCTGAAEAPSVSEPNELLSVAWQPVGPSSTAVQIQVPPCGRYFGWTQVPETGGALADQLVVAVPFDPDCGTTVAQSQPVDQVVPLGSGQAQVAHAPVGPIQALQALPSN